MNNLFIGKYEPTMRSISKLLFTNPFTPLRIELEKEILGSRYKDIYVSWHNIIGKAELNANIREIDETADHIVRQLLEHREELSSSFTDDHQQLWDHLALYWLFCQVKRQMMNAVPLELEAETSLVPLYDTFRRDYEEVFLLPGRKTPPILSCEDCFAVFYQLVRAVYNIYIPIAGGTRRAAEFRSAVWNSIFTSNGELYYQILIKRMNNFSTVILGESGTGKELAAQAIAYSHFIPFDAKKKCFTDQYFSLFHPINIAAFPSSLIDSQLFGYMKGAFTGANNDRKGFFEDCSDCGTVFLDEFGEITRETQTKLLRVLQTRQFTRIGSNTPRTFTGRVIGATNADMALACQEGRFRKDLFYRMCSDIIITPPLREILEGSEKELYDFISLLLKPSIDSEHLEKVAAISTDWIKKNLGLDYPWPGNARELGQCIRNILVGGKYIPILEEKQNRFDLDDFFYKTPMRAEEVQQRYVRAVHQREGSILGTAKATGLNRRTIKKILGEKE